MKQKIINIITIVWSGLSLLFFFACRCCWSGISKVLGADKNQSFLVMNTPLIFMMLLLIVFVFACLFLILQNKKMFKNKLVWDIVLNTLNFLFTIVILVIVIMGAIDYLDYIFPTFLKSILIVLALLFIGFLIYFYPQMKKYQNKWLKTFVFSLLCLATLVGVLNIGFNHITYQPVCYAVEDEYQIVFSSSQKSIAWVEIGDEKFYDTTSGSMASSELVHKVTVPMNKLDNAKKYKINVQKMIYRGPFGGYKGNIISKEYSFRPVDDSDGIKIYSLSDIHNNINGPVKAANAYSDMDFLIVAGDTVSMVESYKDAQFNNKVCFEITKGEIPVVYARGNHEIKGKYAEDYYKYLGSKNSEFYYTFKLGRVFGIVLDLGEDHDDDWWEYYGTADFVNYQNKQVEMLKTIYNEGQYKKETDQINIVVCHIPLVFVNSRHNHENIKKIMTEWLNKMNIDIHICGHQHDLMIFEPGLVTPYENLKFNSNYNGSTSTYKGYLTDFNFYSFIVSRKSYEQNEEVPTLDKKPFVGVYTEIKENITVSYTNSKGIAIDICNPFYDKNYSSKISYEIKTK